MLGVPKVYRSMYEAAGRPRVGADTCELGVRPPGHPVAADVIPDADGNVPPGGGGMSVFPSIAPIDLKRVPKRLIPLRLAGKVPGAQGDDELRIWSTGAGAFVSGPMTPALSLQVTSRTHGTIGPARLMPLADVQSSLADTRDAWDVEEP